MGSRTRSHRSREQTALLPESRAETANTPPMATAVPYCRPTGLAAPPTLQTTLKRTGVAQRKSVALRLKDDKSVGLRLQDEKSSRRGPVPSNPYGTTCAVQDLSHHSGQTMTGVPTPNSTTCVSRPGDARNSFHATISQLIGPAPATQRRRVQSRPGFPGTVRGWGRPQES